MSKDGVREVDVVLALDWWNDADAVLQRIIQRLQSADDA